MAIKQLRRIPWWLFYTLIIIGGLVPLVRPLGLPLLVDPITREFVDFVEAVEPGSTVFYVSTTELDFIAYVQAFEIAFEKLAAKQGLKVIFVSIGVTTPLLFEATLGVANLEGDFGYKYGEDYVIMPFLAGGEIAMAASVDIARSFSVDYYETALSDLPIFDNIDTIEDCAFVVIEFTGGSTIHEAVRQYAVGADMPLLGYSSACGGDAAPYFGNALKGYVDGNHGAAQLELLSGIPGMGLSLMEPRSLGLSIWIVLLLVANVAELLTRKEGDV